MDLDPTVAGSGRLAGWAGALDLDLAAQDARERASGGEQRRAAVAGGERWRSRWWTSVSS
jgi:hypothetical protein